MASGSDQEVDLYTIGIFGSAATHATKRWQNLLCSMKNPRKSANNTASTVGRGLKKVQQELSDLPLFIQPDSNAAPQEIISPEEEFFRSLLHRQLSKHKAPSALRERIMNKIRIMPD